MTDNIELLLDPNFNFKIFTVENLIIGDYYDKILIEKVKDIYVQGETGKMNISEKFKRFKMENGFIHMHDLTVEIKEQKIQSFRLRDKYLSFLISKTAQDIESFLGKADKVLTHGIMWVTDFVAEASVLVYRSQHLHFLLDIESKKVIEIRIGEIEDTVYS